MKQRTVELIGKNEQGRDVIVNFPLDDLPKDEVQWAERSNNPRADAEASRGKIRVGQHRNSEGLLTADDPLESAHRAAAIIQRVDDLQTYPAALVGLARRRAGSPALTADTSLALNAMFIMMGDDEWSVMGPFADKADLGRYLFNKMYYQVSPTTDLGWTHHVDWAALADTLMDDCPWLKANDYADLVVDGEYWRIATFVN